MHDATIDSPPVAFSSNLNLQRGFALGDSLAPGMATGCVWSDKRENPSDLELIHAHTGKVSTLDHWEQDSGLAGFRSEAIADSLTIAGESDSLSKREPLAAVGYPSVISHPAFAIHRGSLNSERYHPYLCPWIMRVTWPSSPKTRVAFGTGYHGMEGGPVLNERARS